MPHVTLAGSACPSGAHQQHPLFTPLGLGYFVSVLESDHYGFGMPVSICKSECLHFFSCLNIDLKLRKFNFIWMLWTLNVGG